MVLRDPPMTEFNMREFINLFLNRMQTFSTQVGESMDLVNSLIGGAIKSVSWSAEGIKPQATPKRWIKESESR